MQARQRSLETAVFRPSKARSVTESSLSAGGRAGTMALWGRWQPLELTPSQPAVPRQASPRATASALGSAEGFCLALLPLPFSPRAPCPCGLGSQQGVWTLTPGRSQGHTQLLRGQGDRPEKESTEWALSEKGLYPKLWEPRETLDKKSQAQRDGGPT